MPLRILLLLTLLQACDPVLAKRLSPDPVKPVTRDGLLIDREKLPPITIPTQEPRRD